VERLARMAQVCRPAVALYGLPALEPTELRPLLAQAALEGRACPDFCYDPDAGPSWADRFDLRSNPDPELTWPTHSVGFMQGETEHTIDLALTFADAVALEPAYLEHFQVIPHAAWDETQLPLAEWLEQFDPDPRQRSIPFLWVIDGDGCLQRAVLTRELALASRDRMRGWRVVQELAGYENAFAERAAGAAREQALTEAGARAATLERAHAQALEQARTAAARESMERLAAALISPDGFSAIPAAAPTAVPSPSIQAPSPVVSEPAPEEEVVEEETLSFDEPYISSALCTTCNECLDLNKQLFIYNGEKQAYIADASAGTFAELVKAAELCPARCIHPGKPRSGDATATPELIERASKYN